MSLKLLVLSILMISFKAFGADSASSVKGFDIVVIAGQSNAAGWGQGDYGVIEQGPIFDQKILQWNWDHSQERFSPAQDPIFTPAEKNARKIHGFGLPFARAYAEKALQMDRGLIIVNGAVGGSSIQQWSPQENLYRQLIAATRHAEAHQGLDNKVIGVLWHQGEADIKLAAQHPRWQEHQKIYSEQLRSVIKAFRVDLGKNGELPFVAGEMSREWTDSPAIREAFVETIQKTIKEFPATRFVPSEALTGNKNDKIHFDGNSQAILGRRYFQKWNEVSLAVPICKDVFK